MFYPGKPGTPSSNPKVRGSFNAQPGLRDRYKSNVYSFSHDSDHWKYFWLSMHAKSHRTQD